MRIILIRHFMTKGNLDKRYIGRSDEPLLENEARKRIDYPAAELIFSSPMKRCVQTARIIYGQECDLKINDSLIETDFGNFEGKNYEELKDDPEYRKFIDSSGSGQFPNGESAENFRKRCCEGFLQIIDETGKQKVLGAAIICHGGTIMSIMAKFDSEKKDFYSYMVKNGCGYILEFDLKQQLFTKSDKLNAEGI